MTMDSERRRAVEWAHEFLIRLCDRRRTARVPSAVRMEAAACLRHYPHPMELGGWDGRQMFRRSDPHPTPDQEHQDGQENYP